MKKSPSIPIGIPPVNIAALRNHFRTTYQLKEDQVELMIQSSQKSLEVTLAAAREALLSDNFCEQLVKVLHNLKGVLLNMGEQRWAEFARDVEISARKNEVKDYTVAINVLVDGVAEVTGYTPEKIEKEE